MITLSLKKSFKCIKQKDPAKCKTLDAVITENHIVFWKHLQQMLFKQANDKHGRAPISYIEKLELCKKLHTKDKLWRQRKFISSTDRMHTSQED